MNDETKHIQQAQNRKARRFLFRVWALFFLVVIPLLLYQKLSLPDISNREYVEKLLSEETLPRTAATIARDNRTDDESDAAVNAKWDRFTEQLGACLEKQARAYLASGDAFLEERFTRETPRIVSKRLLTACDAMRFVPQQPRDGA